MCLNAKQMPPYKQYKQCRYSVIFLTRGLKKERMRKMTFYIPSAKCRTKTPKTKHSPLSLVFPSVLFPPLENITALSSQKQILHHAEDQLSGPLIVLTLGTV